MSEEDELNPWPAFADMLFMLFVTTMVASAVITSWAVGSEEKLRGCGSSRLFMEEFATCLGAQAHETDNACKVSLEESRLRFKTGEVQLEPQHRKFSMQVADCLADSLSEIAVASDGSVFDSIEFVSIDGHTDCVGEEMINLRLGAGRAATLYELFLAAVDERGLDPAIRARVLSKVTIRSFGKSRPLQGSLCSQDPVEGKYAEHAADRRVEIAVNSRLRND